VTKLAVFGCGKHARRSHVNVEGFEVAALFDPLPESIAAIREVIGADVPSYESEEELLQQCPDVEAVLIASPDKDHAGQLLPAVRARKHVLCEKPIAIDQEGLDQMEEALKLAEANNLVVASCHPRRSLIEDLPYGWVTVYLPYLADRFGPLRRVQLSSIYPLPSDGWKTDRSFLLDKYVHDIDILLRWLPADDYRAVRKMDSYDHYEVEGSMGPVHFACGGTRLHSADSDFVEIIMLSFARGQYGHSRCTIYTKTGLVRYFDGESGESWEHSITPMESEGYDRVFAELMQNFKAAIDGKPGTHTFDELRLINQSAVALAGPAGRYRGK